MATFDVQIPTLGESVNEGVIVRWAKREGETVRADEVLLELETDKAAMEIPAPRGGVVHILKPEGEKVAVGDVVAKIDEDGAARAPAAPAAAPQLVQQPKPSPGPVAVPNLEAASEQERVDTPVRAVGPLSPAVRRLLAEHDLDPTVVPAPGKGGRLTKEDVLAYLERKRTVTETVAPERAAAPAPAPRPAEPAGEGEERVSMTPLRKRIAERLVQAQHTAAILT